MVEKNIHEQDCQQSWTPHPYISDKGFSLASAVCQLRGGAASAAVKHPANHNG